MMPLITPASIVIGVLRGGLRINGGMRNISAGAVLAVTYFPAPVAVPVVLGMVFQQMMASLVGLVLGRQARARQRRTDTASAA